MKKFVVVLLALLTLTSPMTALANSNEGKEENKAKISKLESDERFAETSGEKVRFDGKDIKINSYLINRSNYVRIRDAAALLKDTPSKFMVSYDNKTQKVIITKGENQKEDFTYVEKTEEEKIAKTNKQKIVDSKGNDIELNGYFIDGYNYFRLRDLAKILDFGVAYDFKTGTVLLDSKDANIKDIYEEGYFTAPINKIKTKTGEEDIRFLIYGFEECPYCQKLKAYLDNKGIKYISRDIRDSEEKKDEIFEKYYSDRTEYNDRVYYPTHIITLEKDGKSISKCVVGFDKEEYDEIFKQIEENTYFVENK
ncbi:glutaredoxin domain-containing protein [Peptoniphilus phoceensis]|uniref:glutaredoxin domain-containing protein n=1 Tax=Peptoniphilus phoceensis TaxID=1720298 RepID=UPI000780ED0B|nr:glutaredoxin domain-containing protein [Peptoniphilus phoceensis]